MWQRSGKSFVREFSFDRSVDSPLVSRRVSLSLSLFSLLWNSSLTGFASCRDSLVNRSLNDRSGSSRAVANIVRILSTDSSSSRTISLNGDSDKVAASARWKIFPHEAVRYRRETGGRGCARLRVAETAYRYRKTEGQGKRKGDRTKDEDSLGISMRRLSRRHPSTAAPSCTFCATTRSRPLIFHPVTPINLTAVSESPLWRYPIALSLSPPSLDTLPSAISDFDRCHFRFPDFNLRLLNTKRYVVVWRLDAYTMIAFLVTINAGSFDSTYSKETDSATTFYKAFSVVFSIVVDIVNHLCSCSIYSFIFFVLNIYDKIWSIMFR